MPKKDKVKELTGKLLTKKLRELALDIIEIDPGSEKPTTRAEKLARVLWDHALGFIEQTTNKTGEIKEVRHSPAAWAITLLYDRLEGKVAPTSDPGTERPDLGEKLKATSAKRINRI